MSTTILRSETMAGDTISMTKDIYTLTLYSTGNCFSDSHGEIIAELPEYDIKEIKDSDVEALFDKAYSQYCDMKSAIENENL